MWLVSKVAAHCQKNNCTKLDIMLLHAAKSAGNMVHFILCSGSCTYDFEENVC